MSTPTLRQKLVLISNKWQSKIIKGVPDTAFPSTTGVANKKKPFYIVPMFPYPSGNLHMGHVRVYLISDTLNRYHQMKGENVIHPIGWDSFGLPAENAAIERNLNPLVWTKSNIANMKQQIMEMGVNFNWERELSTCESDYYKFTQWLFIKLFENGLAYKKEAEINWDPTDMTVLANEQIDSNGRSWRSGAVVEKRLLSQWFLKITKFVDELDSDLNTLKNWPENVKLMQKKWIDLKKIHTLRFNLENCPAAKEIEVNFQNPNEITSIKGVQIPLNHQITKQLSGLDEKLSEYIKNTATSKEQKPTKYGLENVFAVNPITNSKIPVYVSSVSSESPTTISNSETAPNNVPIPETLHVTLKKLQENGIYKSSSTYNLNDWLISRQRYWGTPIPIIYCNECGTVPVPEKDLPVELPPITGVIHKTGNPLEHVHDFVNCKCPKCGGAAKRETDTMDTFMDSSWYFFRYLDPKNDKLPFDKAITNEKMPVDIYVGGVEHSILHLLYARFIAKFLRSINFWDSENGEPFTKLLTQGMVQARTFVDSQTGQYLTPDEVEELPHNIFQNKETKAKVNIVFEKMSKSKHNGTNPHQFIDFNGADVTRAHVLFQAPINEPLLWGKNHVSGTQRWIGKLFNVTNKIFQDCYFRAQLDPPEVANQFEVELQDKARTYINYITSSFENGIPLNTVISDYMKLTSLFTDKSYDPRISKSVIVNEFLKYVSVMYPVVPAMTEELVEIIKQNQPGLKDWNPYKWPVSANGTEVNAMDHYKVIVNGRMRFRVKADKNLYQQEIKLIRQYLLQFEEIARYVRNRKLELQLRPGTILFDFKINEDKERNGYKKKVKAHE